MSETGPSVNLKCKMKVAGKWTFVPLVRRGDTYANGLVLIDGKPARPEGGTYYIEWHEGRKRLQRPVGSTWRAALDAHRTQRHVLALRAGGAEVDDAPQISSAGLHIKTAIERYLEESQVALRHKSHLKYRNALREFAATTRRTLVKSVTREDILAFMRYQMTELRNDPSTAKDKGVVALTVMRQFGAEIKMRKGDWPRMTERQPEVYRPDVLKRLFAAADRDEFELFQTFLGSGFREQEIGFLAWDDFDEHLCTLKVRKKPEHGFYPKNYQERTVPIVPSLAKMLLGRRRRYAGEFFIFPTSDFNAALGKQGGKRDRHMLDRLKKLARRAGLNCGQCKGTVRSKPVTCRTHAICQQFGLHRFRHTYATQVLHDGVDLLSVQKLLGHKDLESTRKYLRALDEQALHVRINSTSLCGFVEMAGGGGR
jgi:integrase/recombinase XerD